MIAKMIDQKHERWPDLLGTVALAYNSTIHTTTGYSPHELFYSFAPSCPLDAVVSTPAPDPATTADEFALQSFDRLQEATAFVRDFTGRNITRMKRLYDSSVKPQSYEIGEKVLLYDRKKRRGRFAKWDVRWVGPFVIENKLNSANYVIKKGRGKPVVIHVDRLRKLPTEIDTGDTGGSASDMPAADPPAKRCKSDTAAASTGAGRPDSQLVASRPLTRPTDRRCSQRSPAGFDVDSMDTADVHQSVTVGHGTDTAAAAAATTAGYASGSTRPRPVTPARAPRQRRRPARFLDAVQARRLTSSQSAARAGRRLGDSDVNPAHHGHSLCYDARVQLSTPKIVGFDSLLTNGLEMSTKFGEWSGSDESDSDSNDTVFERPSTDEQGVPWSVSPTGPGPVGVPP